MGMFGSARKLLHPYYSKFRPIYLPLLTAAGVLPFEAFLLRERANARVSTAHLRYPFALDRGPEAKSLFVDDPNNPSGHEPELAHLLELLVRDDGVFLDVGSNFGYFSIYLATRPNFRGSIHAFEPVSRSFAGLQNLVKSLGCESNVVCHQIAASDRIGTATMEVSGDLGLASIKNEGLQKAEIVQTKTLDSLGLDRVDFMKIDVEGHEASALKGARNLIESKKPFIFLESWAFPADASKTQEPLQFLIERGYKLYLPAWLQPDGSFFVGIGPHHQRTKLALVPFTLKDRATFPSNPINIFAAPASREGELGERNDKLGATNVVSLSEQPRILRGLARSCVPVHSQWFI